MSELQIDANAKIKKAIDEKVPDIIKAVNDFASKYHEVITRSRDGKKQFTDLLEAASQACCIDEFKLYIKYKGAKEGTRGLWAGLADPLNAVIDTLMKNISDNIAGDICANGDHELVRLEVLKRFCGYLMWRTNADISGRGGR